MSTLPTFNCSQPELYSVCDTGWNSCSANLAAFTNFSPMYDAAFVTAAKAAIAAAMGLPDEEQRDEDTRTFRAEMLVLLKDNNELFQRLKRYITKAYPKDQLKIKFAAAGQAHYEKASNEDWNAAKSLYKDADDFIQANTAALEANDNMPPGPAGFAAQFATARNNFNTKYQAYIDAGQNDEVETQDKTEANNVIHAAVMSMFLDGQMIFKNNEAKKKLFTFEQVLLNVAGPGSTGFKGTAKESVTNVLLPNVLVKVIGTDVEILTDAEGKFSKILAAGTYTFIITCEGFQDLQITDFEIVTGAMKTLNITLVPLP